MNLNFFAKRAAEMRIWTFAWLLRDLSFPLFNLNGRPVWFYRFLTESGLKFWSSQNLDFLQKNFE